MKSVFLPRSPAGLLQPAGVAHCCHSPDCGADCRTAQPGSCPLPPGWRGALLSGSFARFGLVLVRRRFFLRCPGPHCLSADRRSPVEAMRSVVDVLCCRVVKERGSVAWPAVLCWRWMNYASAHMHVNALMQFFMRTDVHERKNPRLGGLQEGREGLVVELAKQGVRPTVEVDEATEGVAILTQEECGTVD